MKKVKHLPVQERDSYLVKYYDEHGDLYGMYVYALNEREAVSQVEYHAGKVKVKEVIGRLPESRR